MDDELSQSPQVADEAMVGVEKEQHEQSNNTDCIAAMELKKVNKYNRQKCIFAELYLIKENTSDTTAIYHLESRHRNETRRDSNGELNGDIVCNCAFNICCDKFDKSILENSIQESAIYDSNHNMDVIVLCNTCPDHMFVLLYTRDGGYMVYKLSGHTVDKCRVIPTNRNMAQYTICKSEIDAVKKPTCKDEELAYIDKVKEYEIITTYPKLK